MRAALFAMMAIVAAITVWRVAATHRVFSPTWDEPAHIYSGHDYLSRRQFFDRTHPPLARIAFAFPLRHAAPSAEDVHERIGDILSSRGSYMEGVAVARRGNLLFLLLALTGVFLWAADAFDRRVAAMAVLMFALLPPILAHAGLATTDLPVTAAFALATAMLMRWIRTPDWRHTLLLALTAGMGLAAKFSFPVFFGMAVLATLVGARRWPVLKSVAAAAGALFVVWGLYFFRQLPQYFKGFRDIVAHNRAGHDAYFLGEVRAHGFWDYFPVVLGIKTPIPFLLLAVAGAVFLFRERRQRIVIVIAALILLTAMTSRINLGVRHVLPIYVPLSLVAAVGAERLWSSRLRWSVPALILWLTVNSAAAHPDYLPWMNALAGPHPERVVLDSNFDWGQDVLRLRDACRELGLRHLGVELNGTTDLGRIGMPPTDPIPKDGGAPGWYAVSEGFIIPAQVRDGKAYTWLTAGRGFRRIGKSIRLYHVP